MESMNSNGSFAGETGHSACAVQSYHNVFCKGGHYEQAEPQVFP